MKIRNGFVSNSSSSSFIIIGEKISIKNVDKTKLKSKHYQFEANMDYSEGGEVWIEIDSPDMLDYIKKHPKLVRNGIFDVFYEGVEGVEFKLSKIKIPEGIDPTVIFGEKGNWEPTIEEIEEYYTAQKWA